MPRWPEKTVDAAETTPKEESLILPATGPIIRDDKTIVEADGGSMDRAAELKFMEEAVEVMVHDSTDPNAENPVLVAVNGVNQYFIRNQPQVVKRKFVEGGRHLVEIEQEARNQDDELSVLGSGMVELPSRG